MLDPQSWRPHAEGLAPGQRKRVDHSCGPGRTLLLSRDADGLRAFCFRCNESGRSATEPESLAVKAERLGKLRSSDLLVQQVRGTELPRPMVQSVDEWPTGAALWLYKAGLGRAEIGQMGAYYHPPSDRVVLPVLGGGKPVFWQARAVDGRQPKYLAPAVDRASVLPRWGNAPSPTLTEDILSAFKVGLVAEGWALMGTRVSVRVMAELLARGCAVNIWLDPDTAGQRGAAKVAAQLRAYGIPHRNIVSTKDPKLHTRAEIKEILHE